MAAKVASLLIDVQTDIAKIRKDFDQAGKVVGDFGRKVEAIGKTIAAVFSVQQVISFGEGILRSVDAMDDMAENLKLPVEEFQALQNAALLAGQSIDSTSTALGKFNVFVGKASEGSKDQIERLEALGVKILDINGNVRPTAELLREVATALTSIENPAKRAAAEVDVFGKSGQSVSAIISQWAKGTDQLNKELSALGVQHGPGTIEVVGEIARKGDIAAKQVEVLFGHFYALAKSNAMQVVAASFNSVAASWKAIGEGKDTLTNLGNLVSLLTPLAGLRLLGPLAGSIAGDLGLGPLTDPQVLRDLQATTQEFTALSAGLEQQKTLWGENSIATQEYLKRLDAAKQKMEALGKQASERGLLPTIPTTTVTGGGARNPAAAGGGGVDKFAEAMRRVREETIGAEAAIAAFKKQTAEGTPTRDAERFAKLQQDVANKQSQMTKDLTGPQAEFLKPQIAALETLKFDYDQLKESQREADAINRRYGDGQKEQAETIAELNELKAAQLIGEQEYAAALEETNQRAAEQMLINQGLGEGIQQIAAGWQYAALKMSESQSSFALGQELFTGTLNTISSAISEFARTGEINFQKIAAGWASMLADMAARWVAAAALKAALNAISGGFGGGDVSGFAVGGGPQGPSGGAAAAEGVGFFAKLFGGFFQHGGNVLPGYSYAVGEAGPERFVPRIPGRIEPNGGGGNDITINMGDTILHTTAGSSIGPTDAAELARRMRAAMVDVISNEKRPGGLLYPAGG